MGDLRNYDEEDEDSTISFQQKYQKMAEFARLFDENTTIKNYIRTLDDCVIVLDEAHGIMNTI